MFALDSGPSKYEKEQQKRREELKRRKEKEVRLQKEQAERLEKQKELAIKRREEIDAEERRQQIAEDSERALTGGIGFLRTLKPFEIDGEDDKVILPEESLNELSQKDAFNGAMLFMLTNTSKVSHCGVREFSAPPGTIGLPKKVIASLTDEVVTLGTEISIKYVRLSKCTYIKLQPKLNKFFEVGPVKMCLEENLRFHSSITLGDRLTVWYRGKSYEMIVVELKTKDSDDAKMDVDVDVDYDKAKDHVAERLRVVERPLAATLIDTDVEVDLDLSLESATANSSVQEKAVQGSGVSTLSPSTAAVPSVFSTMSNFQTTAAVASSASISSTAMDEDNTEAIDKSELLVEPESTAADVVRMKIKLPSGATVVRRFSTTYPIYQLFLFCAIEMNLGTRGAMARRLQLSARFPSRNYKLSSPSLTPAKRDFDPHVDLVDTDRVVDPLHSLAEVGFNSNNEAIFVTMA
jgi:hypothetical protein